MYVLSDDLTLDIYERLSPEDIMSMSGTSRRMFGLSRNNLLWKEKLKIHFPEKYTSCMQETEVDWYTQFKMAYMDEYEGLSSQEKRYFSYVKEGDTRTLMALHQQRKLPPEIINKKDKWGRTAFYLSAQYGRVALLGLLYEFGADPNITSGIAHVVAPRGAVDIVTYLRSLNSNVSVNVNVNLDVGHDREVTPAHCAAANGHVNVLETLLSIGVNLDVRDNRGLRPAHYAAANGHVNVLEALLSIGVNLDVQDDKRLRPAHYAAGNGHVNVLTALHRFNVNLDVRNVDGWTPGHHAAEIGHVGVLSALDIFHINLNVQNGEGQTPAHRAAENGHVNALTALRRFNVDLDVQDTLGQTPAHLAARKAHVGVLTVLDRFQVNFNVRDRLGSTPSYYAAQQGRVDVLTALYDLGVDLNETNDYIVFPWIRRPLHALLAVIFDRALTEARTAGREKFEAGALALKQEILEAFEKCRPNFLFNDCESIARNLLALAKKVGPDAQLTQDDIDQFARSTDKYKTSHAVAIALVTIIGAAVGLIAGALLVAGSVAIGGAVGLVAGGAIANIACTMWYNKRDPYNRITGAATEALPRDARPVVG